MEILIGNVLVVRYFNCQRESPQLQILQSGKSECDLGVLGATMIINDADPLEYWF